MLYCTNTRRLLLSIFILVSLLSLSTCDENDDDIDNEAETVEISSAELPPDHETSLSEECKHPNNDTIQKCCKTMEIDDQFIKCMLLHQKKMPKDGDDNPNSLVKFFSCLIECVYKSKKYIGKGESLNMSVVKSDAKKKYKDDPQMKDFMIEKFEYCSRDGASQWSKLKHNPGARVLFAGACKPYLTLVFLCVAGYEEKVKCPYYAWEGEEYKTKDTVQECNDLKSKCEELYV